LIERGGGGGRTLGRVGLILKKGGVGKKVYPLSKKYRGPWRGGGRTETGASVFAAGKKEKAIRGGALSSR